MSVEILTSGSPLKFIDKIKTDHYNNGTCVETKKRLRVASGNILTKLLPGYFDRKLGRELIAFVARAEGLTEKNIC